MSLMELLVTSVIAVLFVGGAAFVWRGDPARKNSVRHSIPGSLTRIEAAKELYAAENRLPQGTWLTLSMLQRKGRLPASADFSTDIHFVPGRVGESTTYHFADGSHKDHAAPPQ